MADMSFQTDTVQSTFNATDSLNTLNEGRNNQRAGNFFETAQTFGEMGGTTFTGMVSEFMGRGGYDSSVVGINVSEVENIIAVIQRYCDDLKAYIDGLDPTADALGAFQAGEEKTSSPFYANLENYMNDVKLYCSNLISNLLAFADKLADVRNQWKAFTESAAANIGSAAGSYATGGAYNRQVQ